MPLQVTRQQVLYFRPADEAPFRIGRFPVFIYKGPGDRRRLLRDARLPGTGREGRPAQRPRGRSRRRGSRPSATTYREIVRGFLRDHIPALAAAPIDLTETCLYTVAPDEHFLVDFLPGRSDVIVASPCSGHGFKFSCLIGRVLADLATGGSRARRARCPSWKLARCA